MVGILHDQGYQRLRIRPALAPTGLHWRLGIGARDWSTPKSPGAPVPESVYYSSGQEAVVFGWPESPGLTPPELADLFVERFVLLSEAGRGEDAAYAAWMREVVGIARQDLLPYFSADWEIEDDGRVPLCSLTRQDHESWPELRWPPD